jgi:hypothetical protein
MEVEALLADMNMPETYEEAVNAEDREQWLNAMNR